VKSQPCWCACPNVSADGHRRLVGVYPNGLVGKIYRKAMAAAGHQKHSLSAPKREKR